MRIALLVLLVPLLAGAGVEPVADMAVARAVHTATALPDGRVLVAGGCTVDSCELAAEGATTELYDPRARRFLAGPRLTRPRVGHTATRLRDGRVLVVGGWDGSSQTATAEILDDGRFAPTGSLRVARGGAGAALLRDGRVLVVGGSGRAGILRSAEVYAPGRSRFSTTGAMSTP